MSTFVAGGPSLPIASRGAVPPFHVMRVLAAAAARRATGADVYDLSAGQPSTPAPGPVLAAARQALARDRIGYTAPLGLPELRAAIAGHYRRDYGLDIEASSVVVTTGSSGGFLAAFLAAFDPGDAVVLPRPGYPAYRNMLSALGCRVIELPLAADFRLDVALLETLDEVPAGVVLASPANPTGSMVVAAELAALVRWCDAHGVRLISDEIYHRITFGAAAESAWQASRRPVVVNSFSKYFCMTGWRLGWLLSPPELLESIDRLVGNFALCPPTLSQHAALAAFEAYDELDANVARYRVNRDLMLERLAAMGVEQVAPADGAFYVYADMSRWTADSLDFAYRLLAETGVAVAPGVDFDPVDGGRFIRMCFAGDTDRISNAMDVLGDWLTSV
ncbi:MAG TPA: aminotransferase class I/II-fold pyridoxal phosphate-dependent enzyme [Jatrophihabitantaceae bacterium]|jgi:aspartate/methionine/tyrosine aminotransferase|nr:aminotransferase class I/II-fold pyridoxal phosphate-dependent enzyme [Jatrophihabitantaceae bacterium]